MTEPGLDPSSLTADADHLLAEYRRSREQLAEVHRALARLSVSESSPDGAITVTVGAQGRIIELDIHDETYRHYRPQRLADTIVRLAEAAAQRAAERAARLIEPVLPPDADPAALLAGTADLRPEDIEPTEGSEFGQVEDYPTERGWMHRAYGGDRR